MQDLFQHFLILSGQRGTLMGARGAIGKRSTEPKLGHPTKSKEAMAAGVTYAPSGGAVNIPTEADYWAPIAQAWYRSLRMSGQSAFYEASDWATAWVAAECLDMFLMYKRSTLLAEFNDMASRLMTTEGDRRRVHVELQRDSSADPDDEAADLELTGWQKRLAG